MYHDGLLRCDRVAMNAQLARAWARLAVSRQIGRPAATRKSLNTFVALDSLTSNRGLIPHFERTVRAFSSSPLQCFYGSASRLAAILPPQPVSPKTPGFCPGCGVALQQNDPNAPGYAACTLVLSVLCPCCGDLWHP